MDFLLVRLEESWPRMEGEVGSGGAGKIAPLMFLLVLVPLILLHSLLFLGDIVVGVFDGRRGWLLGEHLCERWHAGESHMGFWSALPLLGTVLA